MKAPTIALSVALCAALASTAFFYHHASVNNQRFAATANELARTKAELQSKSDELTKILGHSQTARPTLPILLLRHKTLLGGSYLTIESKIGRPLPVKITHRDDTFIHTLAPGEPFKINAYTTGDKLTVESDSYQRFETRL